MEKRKKELDEYTLQAGELFIERGKAAEGMLQRAFHIGAYRAGHIRAQLEDLGVVRLNEAGDAYELLMDADAFRKLCEKNKADLEESLGHYTDMEFQKHFYDPEEFVEKTAHDIVVNLSVEQKEELLQRPDYTEHHFGFGMYIRNHYIHGKIHPGTSFLDGADGASKKIFERVIEMLRNKE